MRAAVFPLLAVLVVHVASFIIPLAYERPLSTTWPYDDGDPRPDEEVAPDLIFGYHSPGGQHQPQHHKYHNEEYPHQSEDTPGEQHDNRLPRSCNSNHMLKLWDNACRMRRNARSAAAPPYYVNLMVVEYYFPPPQSTYHLPPNHGGGGGEEGTATVIQQKKMFPLQHPPQQDLYSNVPWVLDHHHSEDHGAGVILLVEQWYPPGTMANMPSSSPEGMLGDDGREMPRRASMEEVLHAFHKCCSTSGCQEHDFRGLCF